MSGRGRLPEAGQSPAAPTRTCVGCRERAERSRLLRVVARVQDDTNDRSGTAVVLLVPDLRRRLPGRGAWVHPDPGCLELAVRRRAFTRALRLQGQVDDDAVRAAIASTVD